MALDLSLFFLKVDPETFKAPLGWRGIYLRPGGYAFTSACLFDIRDTQPLVNYFPQKREHWGENEPTEPWRARCKPPSLSRNLLHGYYWRPHSNMIAGWWGLLVQGN